MENKKTKSEITRDKLRELLSGKSLDQDCDVEVVIASLVEEGAILPKIRVGECLYELNADRDGVLPAQKVTKIEILEDDLLIYTRDEETYLQSELDASPGDVFSTKEKAEKMAAFEKDAYERAPKWIMNGEIRVCPYCGKEYRLKTFGGYFGHGGTYEEYQKYDVGRKCYGCLYYVKGE